MDAAERAAAVTWLADSKLLSMVEDAVNLTCAAQPKDAPGFTVSTHSIITHTYTYNIHHTHKCHTHTPHTHHTYLRYARSQPSPHSPRLIVCPRLQRRPSSSAYVALCLPSPQHVDAGC